MKVLFIIPLLLCTKGLNGQATVFKPVDKTWLKEEVGRDVVDATIAKIRKALNPPRDYGLLRGIALTESYFGLTEDVLRRNPLGGIWQIPATVHNTLQLYKNDQSSRPIPTLIKKIEDAFNIACFLCGDDYSSPMKSALAAFLFIQISFQDSSIPDMWPDQAQWWAQHYRSSGISRDFEAAASAEKKQQKCRNVGYLDMYFLLDGSISVTQEDFQKALRFIVDFGTRIYSSDPTKVRLGFAVFAHEFRSYHKLWYDGSEFETNVLRALHPADNTLTGYALLLALKTYTSKRTMAGTRPDTSQFMFLITDGESSDYEVPEGAERFHDEGILVYAIGIGSETNEEELKLIASDPDDKYVYQINSFDSLENVLEVDIYQTVCKIPAPIKKNLTTYVRLLPGEKAYLQTELTRNQNLLLNFSTQDGDGNIVYLSASEANPNSAIYDVLLVLKKGWSEVLLRSEEILALYPELEKLLESGTSQGGAIPIYVTVDVVEEKALTLRVEAKETDPTSLDDSDRSERYDLLPVYITTAVLAIIAAVIFGLIIYRRSSYYARSLYKRDSEEMLNVLRILYTLTARAKSPEATLSCMEKLQEQLGYAEQLEIPEKKLKDSYHALKNLKNAIEILRKELKEATEKGKKPPANLPLLQNLDKLLKCAEVLSLPQSELKEPYAVQGKMKNEIDLLRKELKEYTTQAKEPSATIHTMEKLKNKIAQAEKVQLPEEELKEAKEALKKLEERVANVKKELNTLVAEANSPNASPSLIPKLEEQIQLGEKLKLPPEVLQKPKDTLAKLKNQREMVQKQLIEYTKKAKDPQATHSDMKRLDETIGLAEKLKFTNDELKEPKEVLEKLKKRLDEALNNLNAATNEGSKPTAGTSAMKKLEEELGKAEKLKLPKESLVKAYEVLKKLKERLLPILEGLRKATEAGKKPTATLLDLRELEKQIDIGKKANLTPEELKESLSVLDALKKREAEMNGLKNGLKDALASGDLGAISAALAAVKAKKKELDSWDPNDKNFFDLLNKALAEEKRLREIAEAKETKEKRINALRKRLQALVDSKDCDKYELRSTTDEFEKSLKGEPVSDSDKTLIDKARDKFFQITKQSLLKELNPAISSKDKARLKQALQSVNEALKKDITREEIDKDNELKTTIEKAKQLLQEIDAEEKRKAAEIREKMNNLRNALRRAMEQGSNELRKAIKDFEDYFGKNMDSADKELLRQAKSKLIEKIKQELIGMLKPAIASESPADLQASLTAVDEALKKELTQTDIDNDQELKACIEKAKALLGEMSELDRMRAAVMGLKQTTISEIRSYVQPPKPIRNVMEAVYILLGQKPEELKDWVMIQALVGKMGKDSLKRRITERKPQQITQAMVTKAASKIENLLMNDVEEISKASAVFFAWAKCIMKEVKQGQSSKS